MSNNIHIVIFLLFKSLNTFIHCFTVIVLTNGDSQY